MCPENVYYWPFFAGTAGVGSEWELHGADVQVEIG
jgi:hypothetical protein|tara:strand:+ start:1026 stop:1130 length:105 start_codon:yes stop_codon:yes gene_type:complete